MAKVKKTRHTGRYGSRYGVSVRKRVEAIEAKQRKKHVCPKCGFEKVKRISTGIFSCNKCSLKYAGGAFYPQTLSGSIIAKMVAQRAFTPELETMMRSAVEKEPVAPVELSDDEKIEQLTHAEKKPRAKKVVQEAIEEDIPVEQEPTLSEEGANA